MAVGIAHVCDMESISLSVSNGQEVNESSPGL
jgi:hypothetical protein